MSKGGGPQVQTSEPWAGVQPYLTGAAGTQQLRPGVQPTYSQGGGGVDQSVSGDKGGGSYFQPQQQQQTNPASDYTTTGATPGIFPESQRIYQENLGQGYIGQSPEQQALIQQEIARQGGMQAPGATMNLGQQLLGGQYDPNLGGIQGIDLSQARAGQGALDPTGALQQALSGQPNMDVLGQMQQANMDRSMRGFQGMTDAAGRMFTEQINPAIRSGAQVAGQFGGSRQDMAQGMAARDIGEQLTQSAQQLTEAGMGYGNELYGNAYQQAQAQQAATGGMLGQQAQQQAQANQSLEMQKALMTPQMALQNRLAGTQALGAGEAGAGGQFQGLFGLEGMGADQARQQQQFQMDQLRQYANIVSPGAGMGGTTTSPGAGGTSPLTGAIGGGMTAAGIGSMMAPAGATGLAALGGPWTLGIGAGLGLLGAFG